MRSVRILLVALALSALLASVGSSAQPIPLGVPAAPNALAPIWVAELAPGIDPDQAAAQVGLVNRGAVPGSANRYVFGPAGELDIAAPAPQAMYTQEARQSGLVFLQQQVALNRYPRVSDPLYGDQWHLKNTGQGGGTSGVDANVEPAWANGYTGTGVVVSSVDDGVWHTNPDLTPNYSPSLSYDFVGNDPNPEGGWHGTSVAGVMAAADDGTNCGVGSAYDATLSGVRLLGGFTTDAMEAQALGFMPQGIDIYNNSWGPSDNGATLEGPGPLTLAAIETGITSGRNGLGSIYVWASGNGKASNDNVNADGYANSRYTIAVAALSNFGTNPWYSERGSAILISAPSSGGSLGITTTGGSSSGCTSGFGGTSSASPLAAGVIALMLEANPNLTWRDVQHILVQTAAPVDPSHPDWQTNGAGHDYNHFYGFGRIDADAAVALAESWGGAGPEIAYDSGAINTNSAIQDGPNGAWTSIQFNVTDAINVESVDVWVTATHSSRGQLVFELESPSGMVSVLMAGRPDTGDNYTNWRFNSVAHWDELAIGTWTLRVRDAVAGTTGTLNSVRMAIYGTDSDSIVITRDPLDAIVLYDEAVELSVAAAGQNLSYQWYNGASGDTSSPISGAESATLVTDPLTSGALFWVRVDNGVVSVDSATASVSVTNSVQALRDPAFDLGLGAWAFVRESKLKCYRTYVSAPCSMRLKNTASSVGVAKQTLQAATYDFSLRSTDSFRVRFFALADPAVNAVVQVKVKHADPLANTLKLLIPVPADGTWHLLESQAWLYRDDVTKVVFKVKDSSSQAGAKLWVDDAELYHERGVIRRTADQDVLPPPAAPSGFRSPG
ncbi:MAG: S8 family serine peptidase [Chloroflexi bacterium]|nr:S8 family serine peptidase [Chloroflexota bacterium]